MSNLSVCRRESMDWLRKIQYHRSLHMDELVNIYMEALVSNMPATFLAMMETVISDQHAFNTEKMGMDVEFIMHQNEMLKKLRKMDQRKGTDEAARYCSEVVLPDLARKMQQDIAVHAKKLHNIMEETISLNRGQPSSFSNMLSCIVDTHKHTDSNITLEIAKTCYDLNVPLD